MNSDNKNLNNQNDFENQDNNNGNNVVTSEVQAQEMNVVQSQGSQLGEVSSQVQNTQNINSTPQGVANNNVVTSEVQVQETNVVQPQGSQLGEVSSQVQNTQNINSTPQGIANNNSSDNLENTLQNNNQAVESNNNIKKKKSKLPLIIILLILIIGGLFLFYNFYLMNKDRIVKNEIKTIFYLAHEQVNKLDKNTFKYDIENESLGIDGKITMSSNYKSDEIDLTNLNKYNLSYGGVIDKKNNKLNGNLYLNKDNNKVIAVDAYLAGKTLLLNLNEIFSKTLKTSIDTELKDIETTKALKYDNINTLIDKTEKITINNIDKDNISKKYVKKEINGKNDYYTEITYLFDTNKYTVSLLTEYLKDDEVLNILSELSNTKKDDLKERLQEGIDTLKDSKDNKNISFVLYVDKIFGKFNELDIIYKDNEFDNGLNYKFEISKNNNIYNFNSKNNDKVNFTGTYDISKKELNVESKGEYSKYNFKFKENSLNNYVVTVNYSSGDSSKYTISFDINNEVSSTSQKSNIKVNYNYENGKENIKLELNDSQTISKGANVSELSDEGSVDVKTLTEEDINQINSKTMEIVEKIMKDFVKNEEDIQSTFDGIL